MKRENQGTHGRQKSYQQSYHDYRRHFIEPQHGYNMGRQDSPISVYVDQATVPEKNFDHHSNLISLQQNVVELQNMVTGATGLHAQITTNEGELSDLGSKIEAHTTLISSIQKEMTDLKQMIPQTADIILAIEKMNLQDDQSELAHLQQDIIELQHMMTGATGLHAQITTNEGELSDLGSKIETHTALVSNIQKEMTDLKQMIPQTADIILAIEKINLQDDPSELAHLQQDIIELQNIVMSVNGLHEQITTRMVELTDLVTQIEMNTLMITDILNDVTALENAIKHLTETQEPVSHSIELAAVGTQTDMNTVMIAKIQQEIATL